MDVRDMPAAAASSVVSEEEARAFAEALVDHRCIDFGYLYLGEGPRLFAEIAAAPFYYPNTYEPAALDWAAQRLDVPARVATLVDLGAGGSPKFARLLPAFSAPVGYMPCDFTQDSLNASRDVASSMSQVDSVAPRFLDLRAPEELAFLNDLRGKVVTLLGSTLCNFSPARIRHILRTIRQGLHEGDRFVIAADQPAEPQSMLAAYDDATGVTARFNRNILSNVNERFGTAFVPEHFAHLVRWNSNEGRVEMHLQPKYPVAMQIGGRALHLQHAESLLTEWSYKFSRPRFIELLHAHGFESVAASENELGPIVYIARG